MELFLLIFAITLLVAGIAGSLLPILPGPPLSYLALLVLSFSGYATFSATFLIIMAIISLIVVMLDFYIPAWTTGRFGGSRLGRRGALMGTFAGLFFGPLGIIAGPFIGAVIGELLSVKSIEDAIKSGIGSFVGFIAGTGMKLLLSMVILFYFILGIIG